MSEVDRLLRPHISGVAPYVTARSTYRGGLLLDANENSLGPSTPELPSGLNRYPDPANGDLRAAVSNWLGVAQQRLWFGNGSDEVIDLLIRVLVEPSSPVVIPEPSYGLYGQRAAAHAATGRHVRLDDDFDLDVERTLGAAEGASLVILCSPNNPTGNLLSPNRILELLNRSTCVVAVDEAYVEFAGSNGRAESLVRLAGGAGDVPGSERLAVLRTFSKAYGLSGLRLGYGIMGVEMADYLNRVRQPFVRRIYLAPSFEQANPRESAALSILSDILGDGITSRLAQALQLDLKVAIDSGSYYSPARRDSGSFSIYGVPMPGQDLATIEAAMDAVLAEMAANGPTGEELTRIKRLNRASRIFAQDSMSSQARLYGAALAVGGTVADVENWPAVVEAVTAEDVRLAAQKYLVPEHSVTGWLMRTKEAG